jgi:hypothetical protein
MSTPVIYSTNAFLKLLIQQRFFGDSHYVWCSDAFDSMMLSRYAHSFLVPPSSNPAGIYRQLKADIAGKDMHSAKIAAQRASFIKLAIQAEAAGRITKNDKEEIAFMAEHASFDDWRPLIYVIPRQPVQSRLELVPISDRAGFGNEYIIRDLKRSEFDLIEV